MGTTQRMARFITEAKFEDIPAPAVNLAKLCLLDAVGCALYGTTRPLGKIITSLVDELGGKPLARVLGTGIETNSVNAAMANATLGHAEDFDDFTGGHQAVLLMPVVLAMGEEHRLSGKQALLSYIVGFDITLNVTHAVGEDHYGRGWHNTSSIGTLGSTAAAAKMLSLDEMQTRMALGIGATQASGIRANFGTMTKRGRRVEAVADRCCAQYDHEHGAGSRRAQDRRHGDSAALRKRRAYTERCAQKAVKYITA